MGRAASSPSFARSCFTNARTAPLGAQFRVWLNEQRLGVSAKSRFGEALAYIARYWEGLQILLADGRVENRIRPLALTEKERAVRRP